MMNDVQGRPGYAGPALRLSDLSVGLESGRLIVDGVDLQLERGEVLGLVGESGSGKSTTARALLGYCTPGARIRGGALNIGGRPMQLDESMRTVRGSRISYVPQNPGRSLNPSMRIVDAVADVIRVHQGSQATAQAPTRALEMLEIVGLSVTDGVARRFPHQLSGGQQQRVCIAMALSCRPSVVVLDEPTTGLDVITQARIIEELRRLRDNYGLSMVYVTHDLAVVNQIADTVAVMYAGRIVESGPAKVVLTAPRHPYAQGLLRSTPDHDQPRELDPMPGISAGLSADLDACAFADRCSHATHQCRTQLPALVTSEGSHSVRCWHADAVSVEPSARRPLAQAAVPTAQSLLEVRDLVVSHRVGGKRVVAAHDVTFTVNPGSCVALVGQSGSGKTTIARAIAGLHRPDSGTLTLAGAPLAEVARRRNLDARRRLQIVFQNPADALNPRRTVADEVMRPAIRLRGISRRQARAEVGEILDQVRIPARVALRYPSELSGGELQRISIARALAAKPDLILCDEITSALDVSVQAAVLNLLNDLRRETGMALLFITHDFGVVATVADEVLVLDSGIICEQGSTSEVLADPEHDYTRSLLAAAPSASR